MEDVHRKNQKDGEKNAENNKHDDKKQDQKSEKKKNSKQTKKKSFAKLVNWKWVVTAFLSSLVISIILSLLSSEVLEIVPIIAAVLILFAFVALGVVFDIVGLAVSTANDKPFHSMASQKIRAGKIGISLIRRADQVSSFCNDVIGDICGVVSGSAAATVAVRLAMIMGFDSLWINLILCGLVSAMTVGCKAIGKALGLNYSVEIVTIVSKILAVFSRSPKKNKNSAQKKSKKIAEKDENKENHKKDSSPEPQK